MIYKNKKARFLFIALLTAFLLSGCDKHREERASLLRQKNSVEAELVSLKAQQAQISQSVASLTSGIDNQTETLRERANRQVKLKDELAKFVLDHKLATLAVIAAGGGAAGVLNKNLDDDTKSVLAVAGIIGGIYCLSNYAECADVTTKILYYGSRIDSEEKAIGKLKSDLSGNQAALEKNKQTFAALGKTIDEKTLTRNSLQEKHDALLCQFCF